MPTMNPEIRVTDSNPIVHVESTAEPEQAMVATSSENDDSINTAHLEHSFSEGNFRRMISETLEDNQNRRNSLPPGFLEHGAVNSICGKILRYMGDDHFSKTCGKHLRCMGDELCYTYLLKNVIPSPHRGNEHHISNSQSLPDLHHFPNQLQHHHGNFHHHEDQNPNDQHHDQQPQ